MPIWQTSANIHCNFFKSPNFSRILFLAFFWEICHYLAESVIWLQWVQSETGDKRCGYCEHQKQYDIVTTATTLKYMLFFPILQETDLKLF